MLHDGNGKISNRVTIALDDNTFELLKELKEESSNSQSEILRRSIRFYHEFKKVIGPDKNNTMQRMLTYMDLLSHGEHVILDVDHYLSFLKFIEESPNRENFWTVNKSIGKAHAEEFSQHFNFPTIENIIERLEICNFFKIVKDSPNRYTLLLGSDIQKNFIKSFLKEIFQEMGFDVKIKESLSKLKINLNGDYKEEKEITKTL